METLDHIQAECGLAGGVLAAALVAASYALRRVWLAYERQNATLRNMLPQQTEALQRLVQHLDQV